MTKVLIVLVIFVIPSIFSQNRIFGGSIPNLGDIPYIVHIRHGSLICGGSIISEYWVVTAAHCVTNIDGNMLLFYGALHTNNRMEKRVVDLRIVHPEYNNNANLLINDIALLRSGEKIDFTEYVKPIALNRDPSVLVGMMASASGWGYTRDPVASPVLLSTNLKIVRNSECISAFGGRVNDYKDIICAKGPNMESTCGGDSGGPLVINHVLVGLTSFGLAAGCTYGYPVAFTRISSYVNWIESTIQVNNNFKEHQITYFDY